MNLCGVSDSARRLFLAGVMAHLVRTGTSDRVPFPACPYSVFLQGQLSGSDDDGRVDIRGRNPELHGAEGASTEGRAPRVNEEERPRAKGTRVQSAGHASGPRACPEGNRLARYATTRADRGRLRPCPTRCRCLAKFFSVAYSTLGLDGRRRSGRYWGEPFIDLQWSLSANSSKRHHCRRPGTGYRTGHWSPAVK